MQSFRRFTVYPWVQKFLGVSAAEYFRFVRVTSRFGLDPADIYERVQPDMPAIVAMWHGQHFMMPFFKRREHKVKVLISRHRDGEINAIARRTARRRSDRGSGTSGAISSRRAASPAFKQMLDALSNGYNVALTADVPKISRVAGAASCSWRAPRGADLSGRGGDQPPHPVAQLGPLGHRSPFGRFAIAVGEPVRVAAEADETALEEARRMVETGLNRTTERAYAIAEGRAEDFDWRSRTRDVRLA